MIIARSFLLVSNHVESDDYDLFFGCRNQWHLCIGNIQIMQMYQIWSCTNLESTAESGPECHPGREELNPTAFEVESERKVCFLSFFLRAVVFFAVWLAAAQNLRYSAEAALNHEWLESQLSKALLGVATFGGDLVWMLHACGQDEGSMCLKFRNNGCYKTAISMKCLKLTD